MTYTSLILLARWQIFCSTLSVRGCFVVAFVFSSLFIICHTPQVPVMMKTLGERRHGVITDSYQTML